MIHSEAQEAKDQTSKDNKYTPITLERGGGGGEGEGEGDEPFLHPDGNLHSDGNLAVQRDLKITQISVPEKHGLRKLLAYVGPGFLVAIAYLDPGNFESDLQAGARYKYEDGCRYNIIECSLALLLSFTINVAVVSVSGAVCSNASLSDEDKANCSNLDLNRAPFLLKHVLGKWSSTLFGIALLASGQSSTITGTYAGQYVMQGFLQLRFAPWIRNMLTRCVAIIPSLVAALIGGSSGAGNLIVMSSMILSFELPFALLPLLKFTSNNVKMGPHVNSKKLVPMEHLDGFGGTHLHGASSLLDDGLFDGDLWWKRFTSLLWMIMVDGHLVVWLQH